MNCYTHDSGPFTNDRGCRIWGCGLSLLALSAFAYWKYDGANRADPIVVDTFWHSFSIEPDVKYSECNAIRSCRWSAMALIFNRGGRMGVLGKAFLIVTSSLGIVSSVPLNGLSQERVKVAYSSADASNTVWFTALDAGLYRQYGLDVELIFIQSSTMSVSTVVSGDIQVANVSGGAVASAAVGGASLVMTACYINTLPYELIVQESVKSVEDLRGKSVGISRVGSSSDVAARVLIKNLGLERSEE